MDRIDLAFDIGRQRLFDPAEEQFHLPASTVDLHDGRGLELKIVAQKNQARALLGVEVVNPPQERGIATRALGSDQANGSIGTLARGMIDPTLGARVVARVALGAGDQESHGLSDQIETPLVYIPPIEQIERPRLYPQSSEKFHIVHPPAAHVNSGGNVAARGVQGVKFHRALGPISQTWEGERFRSRAEMLFTSFCSRRF